MYKESDLKGPNLQVPGYKSHNAGMITPETKLKPTDELGPVDTDEPPDPSQEDKRREQLMAGIEERFRELRNLTVDLEGMIKELLSVPK